MKSTFDINDYVNKLTPEQLEESKAKTKQRMLVYKLLAVITFFAGGIGLFLPFGKLAQLYSCGYNALCRKKEKNFGGWALLGFIMSLIMVVIGKIVPSILAIRVVFPKDFSQEK